MTDSLTARIATHLLRPAQPADRSRARLHLLDWLGCVGGARNAPVAAKLRDLPPLARATWLGNVLEMDDVHRQAILHPGPVVWPAALSVEAGTMDAALDGALAGYEAAITIGAMFDARHYAFHHNTATAGVFAVAATAARILGADAARTTSALGLAGTASSGLWQMRHEPGEAKQWHIAHAVDTGLAAARHALRGIDGPRFILEGPQGVFAATCETPRALVLTEGWRIAEVSFKPWGACRHAHPTIDAALKLRAKGALQGPTTVETYGDALAFCDRPDPKSVLDAKFSLQHAVAIVMERGIPTLADFEPDAIAALASARALVTVAESPTITARYPAHYGATVRSAGAAVALIDTLGDPEQPLSVDGVCNKARALLGWGGIDRAGIDRCIAAALEADDPAVVRDWIATWL